MPARHSEAAKKLFHWRVLGEWRTAIETRRFGGGIHFNADRNHGRLHLFHDIGEADWSRVFGSTGHGNGEGVIPRQFKTGHQGGGGKAGCGRKKDKALPGKVSPFAR